MKRYTTWTVGKNISKDHPQPWLMGPNLQTTDAPMGGYEEARSLRISSQISVPYIAGTQSLGDC